MVLHSTNNQLITAFVTVKSFSVNYATCTTLLQQLQCEVPENIHTPPRKGLEIPWGWGVLKSPKM